MRALRRVLRDRTRALVGLCALAVGLSLVGAGCAPAVPSTPVVSPSSSCGAGFVAVSAGGHDFCAASGPGTVTLPVSAGGALLFPGDGSEWDLSDLPAGSIDGVSAQVEPVPYLRVVVRSLPPTEVPAGVVVVSDGAAATCAGCVGSAGFLAPYVTAR